MKFTFKDRALKRVRIKRHDYRVVVSERRPWRWLIFCTGATASGFSYFAAPVLKDSGSDNYVWFEMIATFGFIFTILYGVMRTAWNARVSIDRRDKIVSIRWQFLFIPFSFRTVKFDGRQLDQGSIEIYQLDDRDTSNLAVNELVQHDVTDTHNTRLGKAAEMHTQLCR